jgi:RHS repeat-associated protein
VQRQITGLEPVNYGYDSRGRLTTVTQGSGAVSRSASVLYNAQGYIDRFTDPAGQSTHFVYDQAGRVNRQTLSDGRIITWSYDANGNVIGLTPPGRPTHTFTYTPVDLEERYNPPSAGLPVSHTQYAYNLDKQLTTITRPDGQAITLGYDAAGRTSTITLPNGSIVLGYSATGRLASLNTSQGVNLSYTYDGFLPISEIYSGPISGIVGRTHNTDFRTTSISVNGNSISFSYDADNLLTKAGALNLARNEQNGLLTGTALGATATTHSYNTLGELQTLSATHSGNGLYSFSLSRDQRGNITQKTETVQGQTVTYGYAYDVTGRLIEVTKNGVVQTTYNYDPNGNRLSAGAMYDDQDRLLTYGGNSYTYTANGELKTKTQGGQTSTYTYDVLGNLRQASVPGVNDIEYVIDGRSRRVGKKLGATLVQGFLYQDGLRPIAELDGSGAVVSRFVYGSRFNVPDYMVKGSTTYRIVSDHLGSPRLIINTADGTIAQRIDYDEFGNITNDTNPGFQPIGFAGGLYDRDTKLTRFGARDYDAETGRWTSKDPIRFSGGDANLYGYVLNDPVNFVDPFGLDRFPPLGPPVVGRDGSIIPPGGNISRFIEKNLGSGRTFGEAHDKLVDSLVQAGAPDTLVNIPTMIPTYLWCITKDNADLPIKDRPQIGFPLIEIRW